MNSRRSVILLLFCAAASVSGPLHAEDWGQNYPDHIRQGLSASFSDPRWIIAAGAVAGLSAWDADVRAAAANRLLPEPLAQVGTYYGYGVNYLAGSAVILTGGFGSLSLNRKARLDDWQTFSEAYAVTTAGTLLIKKFTHRLRPDSSSYDAFPSGHTSTSACVAAHLNRRYGTGAGIPAAALMVITGLSRLHHNRHWFSDVLAGALLGGLIGDGFGRLQRPNDIKPAAQQWQMTLVLHF
jgi:membrane-associated phospholipid phosphatase